MNQEPKLKRPEDVDAIYNQIESSFPSLGMTLNEIEPYINPNDLTEFYYPNASLENHAFNFLWLILCIEGYES